MRKLFTIILFQTLVLNVPSVFSQAGEWMWVRGSSSSGATGTSGARGVPNANNDPCAVYEPAQFTDNQGNFWMYGGRNSSGYDTDVLWRYNPVTNEWTWMNGDDIQNDNGNYGIQGIPSATNAPPNIGYGAATWVDLNGNFWLYGGFTVRASNDLWKFDVSTNMWTWMNGSKGAGARTVYGTQGIPDTLNTPGGRSECASAWTDNAGDLWLFGGYNNGDSTFSDMWRYHIATNTWTWMKGPNILDQFGIYGTKGVEDSANNPSGRFAYAHWKDNKGNLWLFGGTKTLISSYNDLWRFNPVTNNWTWMTGSDTAGVDGVYSPKCVSSPTNSPGQRFENRAVWSDVNGNFWMFGGGADGHFNNVLNDLWMYCVTTNQWTWEGGDSTYNATGEWGTMGVANAANVPSARVGSDGWTDNNGHLYLFGGNGNGLSPLNDLWMFTIDTTCGPCGAALLPPVALFQASDTILCTNDCINYVNECTNATSWQWSFPGGLPPSSSSENPQSVCYLTSGIYNVSLIASNSGGSDTLNINNYINVSAAPPTPIITQVNNDTLLCSTNAGYISYQWYLDSALITNATDTFLVISKSGNYNVDVTGTNGCKIAVGINVVIGIQNYMSDHVISLWPNPVKEKFTIHDLPFTIAELDIYNVLGQVCSKSEIVNLKSEIEVDASSLPAGMYFVQLIGENERWVWRFVKD